MKRQCWVEFPSPDKDIVTLTQWADRRGAIILSRDYEPAYLMLTAEQAKVLLGLAMHSEDRLPLDQALRAYQKMRAGRGRRAYRRLPFLGPDGEPRRPLPSFGDVTAASLIIGGDAPPEEKRRRLAEHVKRWPDFLADELLRLYDDLACKSHETWVAYNGYMNQLIEHAVLRKDLPRTNVPIVRVYGSRPNEDE